MPRKTKDLVARAERIAGAWKRSHPQKTFSGLTLNAFVDAFRTCREVRLELAEMISRRRVLLQRRRNSDNSFKPMLMGVVHAVRGDPDVRPDPLFFGAFTFLYGIPCQKRPRNHAARDRE